MPSNTIQTLPNIQNMPSDIIKILPSNNIQNLILPHYSTQNIQDVMTPPGEVEKWTYFMEKGAPTTKSLVNVIKSQKIVEPSNDEKLSQELGSEWITPVKNRQSTNNTNSDLSEASFEKLKPLTSSQSSAKVNEIFETREASRAAAKKWTAPVYNPMVTSAYSGYYKSAINLAQVY